jgi:hypothetical protein
MKIIMQQTWNKIANADFKIWKVDRKINEKSHA